MPGEFVAKLRQVDVLLGHGKTVAGAGHAIGVGQVTHSRWHQKHGGLKLAEVKRMKRLGQGNQRLRRAIPDLMSDKLILTEAAK